tara:strand:- start:739 stop:1404 length:666 start_codon:yes stop_codon:yes gene_type:complete
VNLNEFLALFQTNLYLLRKIKNYSQREMATRINISFRTYQRLESGEAVPSLIDIYNLSKEFDLSPVDIIDFSCKSIPLKEASYEEIEERFGITDYEVVSFIKDFEYKSARKLEVKKNILSNEGFHEFSMPLMFSDFKFLTVNDRFKKSFGATKLNLTPEKIPTEKDLCSLSFLNKVIKLQKNYFLYSFDGECRDPNELRWKGFGKVCNQGESKYLILARLY